MKVRVCLTMVLDDKQIKALMEIGKMCGHDFDHTRNPRTIIQRYLESKVKDAVYYCHEYQEKD